MGSGGGWKSGTPGDSSAAALGPRQVRQAGVAGFALGVLRSAVRGPLQRRPGLSRRATASCGAARVGPEGDG